MKIDGKPYQTIWLDPKDEGIVHSIDQRKIPFQFLVEQLTGLDEVCVAIRDMHLRGAPLIGVAAAFGLYLAGYRHPGNPDLKKYLSSAGDQLLATRPTAVNLKMAVDRQLAAITRLEDPAAIISTLKKGALQLLEEEKENCRMIGVHGLEIIKAIASTKGGEPVNILTHCNAGWLACVDYGTATAPIYLAHDHGIKVHVWVDETRPRNQGARLTAWELGQHGVDHTLIADNTGGLLMQQGKVDMVIVGSDRTTRSGDVANKIGTYLKALAAFDNRVPFYAALPLTTVDWEIDDGVKEIPIEERSPDEVHFVEGFADGRIQQARISPQNSAAMNLGFDVTPARLVTGIITERGVCPASAEGLARLRKQA
ncbi:MAG: S-methyl-5-thioribose-1-phosphate isomerase [Bacteroidales bacterium]|nr:S-methyl-5-thioribose-1-phosphate isomerase [Bacteroidales bacterium]